MFPTVEDSLKVAAQATLQALDQWIEIAGHRILKIASTRTARNEIKRILEEELDPNTMWVEVRPAPPEKPKRPKSQANNKQVKKPKLSNRGRPPKYSEEQKAEWRRQYEAGEETYTSIGRKIGKSRQWVHGMLNPPNPSGSPREIKCLDCSGTFHSRAKHRIEQCQRCGSPWFDKPKNKRKPDEVWPPPEVFTPR